MASIKDLKKRIGTVKNTQQITRAMKMVSAAKLRRAQEGITNQRPYARRTGELVNLMISMPEVIVTSPLVQLEKNEDAAKKKVLLVLVTSDRGLCGGFNANIIKGAMRWFKANQSKYEKIEFGFVGRRGYDFYKTKKVALGPYYPELGGKVSYAKAKTLAQSLVEYFTAGNVDEVHFIFNEFKNAVTQTVIIEQFLPLQPQAAQSVKKGASEDVPMFIVKPSPTEVLDALLQKHFSIQAFRVLLDSQASEHGARMSAMENATKNAGEMIKKLTLQYNKQRQAGITKELLEIISGSESQKG